MGYIWAYIGLFSIWVVVEIMTAPKGWEDEHGFHYGEPHNTSKGEGESDSWS